MSFRAPFQALQPEARYANPRLSAQTPNPLAETAPPSCHTGKAHLSGPREGHLVHVLVAGEGAPCSGSEARQDVYDPWGESGLPGTYVGGK